MPNNPTGNKGKQGSQQGSKSSPATKPGMGAVKPGSSDAQSHNIPGGNRPKNKDR